MNVELTSEQRLIRDSAYKWALNEIAPLQERIDEEDWLPPDIFRRLGAMGFLGVTIGEEYGGLAADPLTEGLVVEQISRFSPAVGLSMVAHTNLCLGNIHKNASEKLKAKYLPALVSGEHVGALGITEPGAGSDALGGIATKAVRRGDRFVLNGTKMFITNGSIAEVILVYAKTSPERGARGLSAFIVEKGYPGFSASAKIKKVGMRGSPTVELVFDDCEVPAQNLVGELDAGVGVVTKGLDFERVACCFLSLGAAHQALEYSIQYAQQRKQFGRPIGQFQMIQAKLAEMYTKLEAARALTYAVATRIAGVTRGGKGTEITRQAAAAILFTAEAATQICNDAVQIHGGYGYCLEYPVQKLWRDAKLLEIGAGTTEIRKLIIARELLNTGTLG